MMLDFDQGKMSLVEKNLQQGHDDTLLPKHRANVKRLLYFFLGALVKLLGAFVPARV